MHRHRPVGSSRSTLLAAHAAQMRAVPSASERALWSALCRRQVEGVQFRRQVVVGGYIADFAAPAARLIVEVDGGWHRGRERLDARRDRALARGGWRVLRLDAALVVRDLPAAVALVREALGAGG